MLAPSNRGVNQEACHVLSRQSQRHCRFRRCLHAARAGGDGVGWGVSRSRPGDREETQGRAAAPLAFPTGYSTIFAGNSGGKLEHGTVFRIPSMKCVNFWNFIGHVKGFGETAFATESATSKSGKAPILEIFPQAVYQSSSHHAATVLNGQISAKYKSCKSVSFSDGHGGTIRETVHARKAERVGGHPSLLLTEYLTDTKVKGARVVTKALWTIAGTNVYMIDSSLLNVKSPKPTLSSLMLKLIARVRALK
jgi:hypothetical protein